ncbi:hypothetical protein T484DRAFT_1815323 [Baffinella frigidus]|nr:hypothetical protein T484DRAFT_1815323 [Cryptophyta sp. CCMP2293]
MDHRHVNTATLSETLSALGHTFAQIGYQLHAMDYFSQALALCQEVGDACGESICLRSLGRVHHLHGDHSEALAAFDQALTLLIRLGDLAGQSECHEGIAGVHLDLGDARLKVNPSDPDNMVDYEPFVKARAPIPNTGGVFPG